MSERAEQINKLYSQGLTYSEIGKIIGISTQRVYQITGGNKCDRFREIKPEDCIYPNIRKWMNENRVNRPKLTRLMFGEEGYSSVRWKSVSGFLKGWDGRKHYIDSILRVTGLTYEEAFKEEGVDHG